MDTRPAGEWFLSDILPTSSRPPAANKATGGLLLGAPILYAAVGTTATGAILCCFGMYSALEELLITVLAKELNRNRKSILVRET
ncbi:MAG: hypothetical protein GXY67_01900 [Clostridiales bacterium]|nr:hypothetical protein [Clostridiales bacterium]